MLFIYLNFFYLYFIHFIIIIKCDWIEIPQQTSDSIPLISSNDRTTQGDKLTELELILSRKQNITLDKLKKIIGPDFDEEFRKFQMKHFFEYDNISITTTTTFDDYYNDPWRIYDKIPSNVLTTTSFPIHSTILLNNIQPQKKPLKLDDISLPLNPQEAVPTPISQSGNRRMMTNRTFEQPYKDLNDQVDDEDVEDDNDNVDENNFEMTTKSTVENPIKNKKRILKLVKLKPKLSSYSIFNLFGLIDFFKRIQNSFPISTSTTTARNTIQDKIKMLTDFKNKLLINIENRLLHLWPMNRKNRMKRTIMDGHSDVDFPSSEGALITISFLTFAVFLIKLVLQVINTIKSKHYTYNSFETLGTLQGQSPFKIIKQNRNARRLSTTVWDDDIDGTTTTIDAMHNQAINPYAK